MYGRRSNHLYWWYRSILQDPLHERRGTHFLSDVTTFSLWSCKSDCRFKVITICKTIWRVKFNWSRKYLACKYWLKIKTNLLNSLSILLISISIVSSLWLISVMIWLKLSIIFLWRLIWWFTWLITLFCFSCSDVIALLYFSASSCSRFPDITFTMLTSRLRIPLRFLFWYCKLWSNFWRLVN